MALNNSDVVGHARVTKFFKPFARICLHSCQTVGGHEMTFGLHGFAFASGQIIFSLEPPKSKYGNRHFGAESGLDDCGFLDVEMLRDSWSARCADRFAKRQRGSATVPKS